MLVPLLALFVARTITLPPGETHLHSPFEPRNTNIQGDPAGSTLVMEDDFSGPAAIVIEHGQNIRLSNFAIRGNRRGLQSDWYLPLKEAAFADFYHSNGILIRDSRAISIGEVRLSRIRAFPVLVSASSQVSVQRIDVSDCGTLTREGYNNTTGGILFEEGVSDFEVGYSKFAQIAGTAIWTHSYARSPRNARGSIHHNSIKFVARDAIQIGHATRVTVAENDGAFIGYPTDQVDTAHYGTPVALDTAGNVDVTTYRDNHFTDVNGECVNLDGFHEGSVTGNSCVNEKMAGAYPWLHYAILFGNHDPGMNSIGVIIRNNTMRGFAFGGVFLAGSGNTVEGNEFTRLNLARCGTTPNPAPCNYAPDQPDMLRSGIYLADNAGRPTTTKGNTIVGNRLKGFGIEAHCVVAAPNVEMKANTIRNNTCSGD